MAAPVALSTALTEAGCAVTPFAWSDRNSHRARTQAARDLADHLRAEVAKNPKGWFWIVAHSHGGNVALHAAAELRRSQRAAPQVSTIAFATPFIHSRDRKPPVWLIFVLLLFGPLLLLAAGEKIGSGQRSFVDWLLVVIGGSFAAALLLCVAGAVLHGGFGDRRALVNAVHAPAVGRKDLFIVRSAGDEASGLLTTGQFIG
jgi:pimeloyl-ACP methyl ester carboxylesterase